MVQEKKIYVKYGAESPTNAVVTQNFKSANLPDWTLGDAYVLRFDYLDANGDFKDFGADAANFVFMLGLIGKPTSYNFTIGYGTECTAGLTQSSSDKAVAEALNALPSVSAAGGVDVIGATGAPYRITWRTAGARDPFTITSDALPCSSAYSAVVQSGGDSQRQIQLLSVYIGAVAVSKEMQVGAKTATRIEVQEFERTVDVTTSTTKTYYDETLQKDVTETTTVTTPTVEKYTAEVEVEYAANYELLCKISLATSEALLALAGANSAQIVGELKCIDPLTGEVATLMQGKCSLINKMVDDAETYELVTSYFDDRLSIMRGIEIATTNTANDVRVDALNVESMAYGTRLGSPDIQNIENNAKYFKQQSARFAEDAGSSASYAAYNAAEAAQSANAAVQVVGLEELRRRAANIGNYLFDGGVLESPVTAGWTGAHFPMSICFTYDVAQWQSNAFNFFNTKIYPGTGISLEYNPSDCNLRLSFMGVADSDSRTYLHVGVVYKTSKITTAGLPTGKHTMVVNFFNARHIGDQKATVVPAGDGVAGMLDTEIWIDGEKLSSPTYVDGGQGNYSFCTTTNWGGSGNLQFGGSGAYLDGQVAANNFKGVLSRIKTFNFTLSTTSPYTIDDYNAGRDESTYVLKGLQANKSLLALADAADALQIRDFSASGNHALILGDTLPSKSNRIASQSATLTWAASADTKNFLTASAKEFPDNSKITVYMKSTAAITMSATNSAATSLGTAVTLTEDVWQEAWTFFNSTDGRLRLTPNATFTGTLQVSTKVESLI